ncbi:hypothetical protein [Flavobacterium sp. J27]|uniref:hypothetical protein n=1 Tax=Flavobacterium sp. J27 TaxID=2060419 RepID=UPI001031AA3C|nr:hypothetical protein [Flavobacterium sp. J27]
MKKSILNLIYVLREKLIEFPILVNRLEHKEVHFLEHLFIWMKTVEEILSTYNISETSEIAGLRSKIIAQRFNESNSNSKKKVVLKAASEVLYDLQKTILEVVKPFEKKTQESRDLVRQMLLIIGEMKLIHYDFDQPFEQFVNTIWELIISNDQLKAGAIKLKTDLPLTDIRLLIAEEINLEDFQNVDN